MNKLPLALIDFDKTYDLLFFDKIAASVSNKLNAYFGNNGFFVRTSGVICLDRFTPDGFLWASEWSNKVASWLKPLTATWVLQNDELNGKDYGFTPPFDIANLKDIGLPLKPIPSRIYLKVKKGKSARLSWLENAHSDGFCRFYDGTMDSGIEYTKRTRVIGADSEDLIFQFDTQNWLFNSLVIDGDCLVLRTEKGGQVLEDSKDGVPPSEFLSGLLYEKLDWVLGTVITVLGLPENIEVLTGFTATLETTFALFEPTRQAAVYVQDYWQGGQSCPNVYTDFVRYSQPVFQQLPNHYYHVGLLLGDNNKWNDKSPTGNNIGYEPATIWDRSYEYFFYQLRLVFDYFQAWRNTIKSPLVTGYDDWNDGIKRRIFTMNLPTPALGDWGSIEFYTETANQNPGFPLWNPDTLTGWQAENVVRTSYPNFHTHDTSWLNHWYQTTDWWGRPYPVQSLKDLAVNTNGIKKCYRFALRENPIISVSPSRAEFYATNSPWKTPYLHYSFFNSRNNRMLDRPQYYNFGITQNDGKKIGVDGYGRNIVEGHNNHRFYFYRWNTVAIECLGCLDCNLFSMGEVAILRNSIDVLLTWHDLSYSYGTETGGYEGSGVQRLENYRQEKLIKQGVKFLINSTDSENPDIIPTFLPSSEKIIYEKNTTGYFNYGMVSGIPENQRWTFVKSDYSITLNRQLRTSPVNTPLYWEQELNENRRRMWTQSDYDSLWEIGKQIQEDFIKDAE